MTSALDPFRHSDAAYVLGALDDADRRAFEAHLETCPDCQARVAEARSAVDLLAGFTIADVADVAEPEPMPDTLLPGLLRAARRERNRRRGLVGGLAAVAAASAAALIVVIAPGSGGGGPAAQAFVPVIPSPVTATAQLVSRAWGTEVELHCHYAKELEQYLPYNLVVVDASQHRIPAGSWRLTPGGETDFVTGTATPRDQIDHLEITKSDGTPILVLNA